MVIDDLNVKRIPIAPYKADSPLVVNPDAVLAGTIPLQFFQPV
jgi:hypothetical protein